MEPIYHMHTGRDFVVHSRKIGYSYISVICALGFISEIRVAGSADSYLSPPI